MSNRLILPTVLAALLPLIGCGATQSPDPAGEEAAAIGAVRAQHAKLSRPTGRAHDVREPKTVSRTARTAPPIVIAISMDGLNPNAIRKLGAKAPHYRRLMRQGSWTLNARAGHELTDTLPNHTGMMTGRPIHGRSGHQVTFNKDRPRTWMARVAGRYVRGMFDLAHDRGVSTALYTSKAKFDFLNRSWNGVHGARDRVGRNNGRDKIGTYVRTSPHKVLSRMIDKLTTRPARMVFWHNSVPDAAGHDHGFMSSRYLNAVARTDAMLGTLLRALDRRPALKRRVTIILTADHGGRGRSHRDATRLANYRIPFIVWGRGVARGRDLYDLNAATRRDPGRFRPGYAGVQPIRNTDVANLAARLVGVPRVVGFANRPPLRTR